MTKCELNERMPNDQAPMTKVGCSHSSLVIRISFDIRISRFVIFKKRFAVREPFPISILL